jgi:hypothetical protein
MPTVQGINNRRIAAVEAARNPVSTNRPRPSRSHTRRRNAGIADDKTDVSSNRADAPCNCACRCDLRRDLHRGCASILATAPGCERWLIETHPQAPENSVHSLHAWILVSAGLVIAEQ